MRATPPHCGEPEYTGKRRATQLAHEHNGNVLDSPRNPGGRKASAPQVITKERGGRRQVPEDGHPRVGRVCKVKAQEHLPTYRLQQSRQRPGTPTKRPNLHKGESSSATKEGLFGVSGRGLMLPANHTGHCHPRGRRRQGGPLHGAARVARPWV